jgi:hypothetical protein
VWRGLLGGGVGATGGDDPEAQERRRGNGDERSTMMVLWG